MTLIEALAAEGLTELVLLRRGDDFIATARRTFDDGLDFARFNRDFDTDTIDLATPRVLQDGEVRAIDALGPTLQHLENSLHAGRHQMVVVKVHAGLGITTALFVHSSKLGRNNGLHALRAGGFRRHELTEDELDVLTDGANLSRAMSYKNAAADLPMGGCKMTVHAEPIALDDTQRLGFLAYTIESGRFLTGPDMGFLPDHADAMRAKYTRHVTGGARGVLGPTGTPTALGTFLAMKEAAAIHLGSEDLTGKVVAIQGLGAVGFPLARHLAEAGARLVVADPSEAALIRAHEEFGALDVVATDAILQTKCDVLAPCAFGGVLTPDTIEQLDCEMIYGSANNQLAATSKERELELAEMVAKRGILFQVDWTHNTAGVMSGFEEYVRGHEARASHLQPRLERVCRDGTRRILERARAEGRTPTAVAYDEVEARIYDD
ncbi:MAG: Glu/Leu/Phe/Val dehydrogenase family protein [Deltaproteobacteria bacterium]|jgi:leucine dehydrogenase